MGGAVRVDGNRGREDLPAKRVSHSRASRKQSFVLHHFPDTPARSTQLALRPLS